MPRSRASSDAATTLCARSNPASSSHSGPLSASRRNRGCSVPNDTHAHLVLDRFWDALVDDPLADSDDLDPQAAESLRRLHAVASAPPPTASRERVRHRLNGLSGADHKLAAPPSDHPMPLRSLRRDPEAADGHLTMPTAHSLAAPQAIH